MNIKFACPLLLLIAFTFVVGCSKKTDDTPAPDLAVTAAGTYLINSVSQGTTTVPVAASTNATITP